MIATSESNDLAAARRSPLIHQGTVWRAGWLLVACGLTMLLRAQLSMLLVPSDFTNDWVSARALLSGRSIYSDFTGINFGAPGGASDTIRNYHPPFNAVMFLPLALLPHTPAALLWTAGSLLLYGLSIRLVLRNLAIVLPRPWYVVLAGLALCWYPLQAHLVLGQLSLPIIACIVGCWALLRRGRDVPAGLLLGLACLIKLFPGLILAYLLFQRRWRAAAMAVGVLAAGMVLTLAIVGPADMLRYQREIAAHDVAIYGPSPWNVALTGTVDRLLVDGPWVRPLVNATHVAPYVAGILSLGLLLALGFTLLRLPQDDRGNDTRFALVCLTMLLVSPITWQHILPLLVLPFGFFLRDQLAVPDRRRLPLQLLAVGLVSLPDVPIIRSLAAYFAPYRMPWWATLVPLATTTGLLLCWWLVATRRSAVTEQAS
jgi:hypothetical protein